MREVAAGAAVTIRRLVFPGLLSSIVTKESTT